MNYRIGPGSAPYTQEEWFNCLRGGVFKAKPPRWWVKQQNLEGRLGPAPFAIWHKNYDADRQIIVWMIATEEDWRYAGYMS